MRHSPACSDSIRKAYTAPSSEPTLAPLVLSSYLPPPTCVIFHCYMAGVSYASAVKAYAETHTEAFGIATVRFKGKDTLGAERPVLCKPAPNNVVGRFAMDGVGAVWECHVKVGCGELSM